MVLETIVLPLNYRPRVIAREENIPRELATCLFVHGLSPVPFAELFELDLALHKLLVLGGPVVYPLALGAL
jgi:hypothetical protein